MPNPYFRFKQFTIHHDRCAMKVTTDSCLFGAWAARQMKNESTISQASLLDIGTGTGLLSLMIAQQHNLQINALEIDAAAAAQAKENVAASPWAAQIHVHEADMLAFQPERSYDYIISNPPFYENELASAKAQRNTAHHSTMLSLRQLLLFIRLHLKEDGTFFLLLPFKREAEASILLQQEELFLHETCKVRQSVKHGFFRLMLKGGKQRVPTTENEFSIWDEAQRYTSEFRSLLSDYYLYL